MHRALTIVALAAAAISPLAACGDREREGAQASSGALPPAETAAGFVARMTLTDLYEIDAGRIALERATTPEVRSFAETMIADHQRAGAEMQAAIASQRSPARPPAELDAPRRALLGDLRAASDAAFEAVYIDQQVEAHENALRLLREHAETGDTPALRDWARRTAPRVDDHRKMAHALDRRAGAGGSAETGVAGGQRR